MNVKVLRAVQGLVWEMILRDEIDQAAIEDAIERTVSHNMPRVDTYSLAIEAFLRRRAAGTMAERSEIAAVVLGVNQDTARRAVHSQSGDPKLVEEAHLFNLALYRLDERKVIDYASHRGYYLRGDGA